MYLHNNVSLQSFVIVICYAKESIYALKKAYEYVNKVFLPEVDIDKLYRQPVNCRLAVSFFYKKEYKCCFPCNSHRR